LTNGVLYDIIYTVKGRGQKPRGSTLSDVCQALKKQVAFEKIFEKLFKNLLTNTKKYGIICMSKGEDKS
jgi:hypothetical protein